MYSIIQLVLIRILNRSHLIIGVNQTNDEEKNPGKSNLAVVIVYNVLSQFPTGQFLNPEQ